MALIAGRREITAEFPPATSTVHERRPGDIGEERGGAGRIRFFEAPRRRAPGRTDCRAVRARYGRSCRAGASRWRQAGAGQFRARISADRSPRTPVETVTMAARAEMRPLAVSISTPQAPTPIDPRCRIRQLHRQGLRRALRSRRQSPAGKRHRCRVRPSGRSPRPTPRQGPWRKPNGPSTNSTVRCQSPRSLRQRLRGRQIEPAMAGIDDGAVRPYQRGQIILHLALAGIAPADPHPLPGRRRINVEARRRGERCHRIDFRNMDPMGAAIVRHPESRRVGKAAPADPRRRFNDRRAAPGCRRSGAPPRCRRRLPR